MKKVAEQKQQPQQPVAPVEQQPQQVTFEEQMKGLQVTQKQQTALTTLLAEVGKREGAKVTDPKLVDRKLVVLVNGARVAIGTGGGYEALDVRTYPKATVTFMAQADLALAKQTARDAAKAAEAQKALEQQAAANKAAEPVVEAAKEVAAA